MDMATTYNDTRERLAALVATAGPRADRKVPACPDWTVKDVIAHLAGLAADWRAGNVAGYGGDAWTAAQVAERRDRSVDDLLAEWADHAAAISPTLADPAAAGVPAYMPMIVITDLVAHEHDVRGALDRPGAHDSDAVIVGLRSHVGGLRQHFAGLGLPTLEIQATGLRDWGVGHGEPAATLRGDPYELFRATGGRRTIDQVRAMEWSGDAGAFIPHLAAPPYDWPATPLND